MTSDEEEFEMEFPQVAGDYPIFNNYPEKVVDYQLKERERIHKEELEYIKQR